MNTKHPGRGESRRKFLLSVGGISVLALTGCGGGGGDDSGGGGGTGAQYTVQLLGVSSTDGWIFPQAFNSRKESAGYMSASQNQIQAFFHDGGAGQAQEITTNLSDEVTPTAMNESGQVVGIYWDSGNVAHAFTWSRANGFAQAFTDVNTSESRALFVNAGGTVAGGGIANSAQVGLIALPNQVTRNLRDAAGIYAVNDLNDRNQVLGRTTANGSVLWSPTAAPVQIGAAADEVNAVRLNEQGEVAGVRRTASGSFVPFYWTAAEGLVNLTNDPGLSWTVVEINEQGQIAGYATENRGQSNERDRPFIWSKGGGFRYIDVPNGRSARLIALNEGGQVVGYYPVNATTDNAYTWSAQKGFVELNQNLRNPPAGLVVRYATAIADDGTLAGISNQGPLLLRPV